MTLTGALTLPRRAPVTWTAAAVANLLTTPLIYSLSVPLALLDAWITLYQWICFPIYGIRIVRRRSYFVFDRRLLHYLTTIEKLHCAYCSYATGLFAYVREVTARTEQYWCPIKHARPVRGAHSRYRRFAGYADAAAYRHRLPVLRHALATERRRKRRPSRAALRQP
jgi:hypothetical protein